MADYGGNEGDKKIKNVGDHPLFKFLCFFMDCPAAAVGAIFFYS